MEESDQCTYEVAMGDNIYESGNLHDERKFCSKHPGHKEFISMKDFDISHLPHELQFQEVFEALKTLADVTVLIKNNAVSGVRRQAFLGSQFRNKYKRYTLTGTGYYYNVRRLDYTALCTHSCTCRTCEQSCQPKRSWWEVKVKTADCVVFDTIEAGNTEVIFFYDDTDSQTITIQGTRVCGGDLVCVIHDGEMDDFIMKLKKMWWDLVKSGCELGEKYRDKGQDKLCVLISHPHGCPKQISVGKWLEDERVEYDSNFVVWCYNTPTCPGTSGAVVAISWRYWLSDLSHTHSSCGKDGIGRTGKVPIISSSCFLDPFF